jgi:uncharacterized membrane protein YphA (DoxX/SURF4 family)
MFIAAAIIAGLLALLLAASGQAKLAKNPAVMQSMTTVGVPEDRVWLLSIAEIAGAAGLVVGLFWWPIGVAAALGVVLYFVGAVGAHIRVKDTANLIVPAVILVVAVAALALRAVTA